MPLTDALRHAAQEAADALGLDLGFEGEPFVAPAEAHLRCALSALTSRAAALGTGAPSRIDGEMILTAVALQGVAGQGEQEAARIAGELAALFPRGRGLDVDGSQGEGEAVFSAPRTDSPAKDGGRVRVAVRMSFYAILFPRKGD